MLLQELTTLPTLPWQIIALRLVGSVILCGLIGIEREANGQAAGLKTHIMIGLAACVYSLIAHEIIAENLHRSPLFTADNQDDNVTVDPLRIVEAVTSGVAFLAAGMIVFTAGRVKGLTTGAGMWLAASVGLCCGLGLWLIAAAATVLSLLIMLVLSSLQASVAREKDNRGDPDDRG